MPFRVPTEFQALSFTSPRTATWVAALLHFNFFDAVNKKCPRQSN